MSNSDASGVSIRGYPSSAYPYSFIRLSVYPKISVLWHAIYLRISDSGFNKKRISVTALTDDGYPRVAERRIASLASAPEHRVCVYGVFIRYS